MNVAGKRKKTHELPLHTAWPYVMVCLMEGKFSSGVRGLSYITPKRAVIQICIITCWLP